MRYATTCVLAAVCLAGFSRGSFGADAPAAPIAAPANLVVRVYDVRDLVQVVPDYPNDGALVSPTDIGKAAEQATAQNLGGTSGSSIVTPGSTPPPPPSSTDQLINVLMESVDTGSWRAHGGASGAIVALNGHLIVTQTEENQSAVQGLLANLDSQRAATVRVRADWVLLHPGQLDALMKNGADDKTALPEVSRDLLNKLSTQSVHYAATISCFSGQTVHLASGRAMTTITDATPTVAQQAVAYEVKPELVQYGLSLQVKPTVSNGSITLDVKSEASEGQDTPAPSVAGNGATNSATNGVDRINAVVQHFHTTVQIPLGKPVLVGGMTIEPNTAQPAGDQLYLIMEVDE